ncbi:hypothetical protein ES703_29212 [subsurface metagenome]
MLGHLFRVKEPGFLPEKFDYVLIAEEPSPELPCPYHRFSHWHPAGQGPVHNGFGIGNAKCPGQLAGRVEVTLSVGVQLPDGDNPDGIGAPLQAPAYSPV